MAIRDLIPWGRDHRPLAVQNHAQNEEHPFLTLHREMNRLFDDVFGRAFMPPVMGSLGSAATWPRIEVAANDRQVRMTAELPGVEEKDVDLTLEKDALVIAGETRTEKEDKDRGYSERYYGRFQRLIPLPYEVDEDAVEADFRNGVLTITLPKSRTAPERGKRIQIGGKPAATH